MIKEAINRREIVIEPFDLKSLGTNSYDVHLGNILMVYERPSDQWFRQIPLDCKVESPIQLITIPMMEGFVLRPGKLYLASTVEYTETWKHVPFLDGKSSVGRLGIFIHCTAGRGDVGFCNHWTMEIVVVEPVRVYAGMPIGQLIFFETGEVDTDYQDKKSAKYNDRSSHPQPSRMWKNFKAES